MLNKSQLKSFSIWICWISALTPRHHRYSHLGNLAQWPVCFVKRKTRLSHSPSKGSLKLDHSWSPCQLHSGCQPWSAHMGNLHTSTRWCGDHLPSDLIRLNFVNTLVGRWHPELGHLEVWSSRTNSGEATRPDWRDLGVSEGSPSKSFTHACRSQTVCSSFFIRVGWHSTSFLRRRWNSRLCIVDFTLPKLFAFLVVVSPSAQPDSIPFKRNTKLENLLCLIVLFLLVPARKTWWAVLKS